jgi:hypothetical protein
MDKHDYSSSHDEEQSARTTNIMRTMAKLAKARHAFDEAREWAEKTLEEAGLPTVVGWYAPGPDEKTLVPAPPDITARETEGHNVLVRLRPEAPADVSWIALLPEAVARVRPPGAPERTAAKLLYQLACVGECVRRGDAAGAAGEAFYAGMRWKGRQLDELARIGADVASGGQKAGAARAKHDPADKLRWAIADRRLEREQGITNARQRAALLAPHFSCKPEVFRREVRELRRQTDPKQ